MATSAGSWSSPGILRIQNGGQVTQMGRRVDGEDNANTNSTILLPTSESVSTTVCGPWSGRVRGPDTRRYDEMSTQ